ncbi:MAG: hypothetical protein ACQXXD_05475 [Thermoplasmatota archaeon]|jgi:hypothetical protein
MNKKIFAISILAFFTLIAIMFATTVTSNTAPAKKKESPLYKIRTRLALGERIKDLVIRFLRQRIFLRLPILNPSSGNENNYQGATTSICGYCNTYEKGPKGCHQ